MANITSQICTTYNTTIRRRHRLKPEETDYLTNEFQNNPKPTRKDIQEIASEIEMSERTVQIWFQNKRAKLRRLQKESTGRAAPQEAGKTLATDVPIRLSAADNTNSQPAYGNPEWIQLRSLRHSTANMSTVKPSSVKMDEGYCRTMDPEPYWLNGPLRNLPLQQQLIESSVKPSRSTWSAQPRT
ncbi:unnamed protein product [Umbelopsis vinacea]